MNTISLNGLWELTGYAAPDAAPSLSLTAHVPGTVAEELSAAGLLPADLYYADNVCQLEKYEGYSWEYTRHFTLDEVSPESYLVFEGVDCLAEYTLNGHRIGESSNMMIPHEFRVDGLLLRGENVLTVRLASSMRAIRAAQLPLLVYNGYNNSEDVVLRRPLHTYGWDIMPRAVTAGLFRPVRLELRDRVRFSEYFFRFSNPTHPALCYQLYGSYEDLQGLTLSVTADCGDSHVAFTTPLYAKCGAVDFQLENPKLWFPRGYGEPNLYTATLSLYRAGELLHRETTRFGVRTVVLERTDTTDGIHGSFRFLINGVEVFCKGSNWVPMDALHSHDAERYGRAIDMACDIGCNMLRCWGGNLYEEQSFFDLCDERGLMVWQDFAMACTAYPQDDAYCAMLCAEAESVVRRYRHHPSIVLWCGDNEVDSGHTYCERYQPSLNRLTREILPHVVYENDIGRPYLASSPFYTDEMLTDLTVTGSEAHQWGVRDWFKSSFYSQSPAHFISETGYHGAPSLTSIRRFISPEHVFPYRNAEWTLHSSDQRGNDSRVSLMEDQVRQLFGMVPTEAKEYVTASQISQAEAVKYFIERMRIRRPHKCGILWWNLVDGWPQMSDAVVDYYYTKKLAYGYIKRCEATLSLIFDELLDKYLTLYACNDSLAARHGTYRVTDLSTGKVLAEGEFSAPVNGSAPIAKVAMDYSAHTMLHIEWQEDDGTRGHNHYLVGFPPFSYTDYCRWMTAAELTEDWDGAGE